jgi:hypothetical protein
MPGEVFMLIVFQRQLLGSYPRSPTEAGYWNSQGHRVVLVRPGFASDLTLTYPRNGDRKHHSFEFRTTTLFRFDR